jgi:hypothetical protein
MRGRRGAGGAAPALWIAVLGLLLAIGALPARAGDLPDLEARVAELELTTPRGNNRRLVVHLYGQVNRALLVWDDGFDSGVFGVDNHTSSSRLGLIGRASIAPGWTAGYRFEIEAAFPSSHEVFNGPDGTNGLTETFVGGAALRVRQSYWDIVSKDLGRLSIGFQSPATDDITLVNLGSQMNDAAVHYNNNFGVRLDMAKPFVTTDLRWGDIAHNIDSLRGNFVRYDTPVLMGLMLSTAWNDDIWDVALRYQNGAAGFRFAGGVGYMKDNALKFDDARGSASVLHTATGLYLSGAAGWRDTALEVPVNADAAYFYYAQIGISRQWFDPGKTTLYVDRGIYKNFNVSEILSVVDGTTTPWGTLVETEVRRWGVGVEQAIDASGMLLYAQAHFYDPTIMGSACEGPDCAFDPVKNPVTKLPAASWQGFVVGARIQF